MRLEIDMWRGRVGTRKRLESRCDSDCGCLGIEEICVFLPLHGDV